MESLYAEIKKEIDEGRPDAAIDLVEQQLSLHEGDAQLHYLRGCAYMKKSDWKGALESLQRSEQLAPNGPAAEARQMLSDILNFYNKDMYNP